VEPIERAERSPSIVAADRLTRARVKARAVLEQAEELRRVIEYLGERLGKVSQPRPVNGGRWAG
jgi:hypothetical protein